MANHKSAIKRIRANERKHQRNRFQVKMARAFVKKLKETKEKEPALELLKKVSAMLDRLARKNIVHKNNIAHKKSKLTKYVNSLS